LKRLWVYQKVLERGDVSPTYIVFSTRKSFGGFNTPKEEISPEVKKYSSCDQKP